ncbi:MAG: hypothetical protein N2246_01550 [Candidatus Sumerlaeia bacterium]|nr:hypothetical protein [Candidatus Sumerlaeia bacterium]
MSTYAVLDLRELPWNSIKYHPVAGFELIKATYTRRVIKFDFTPAGEEKPITLFAKQMRIRRWRQVLSSLLRKSKAHREWELGYKLLSLGFDTPQPVIYAEEKAGWHLKASYIVLIGVMGKQPADVLIKQSNTIKRRQFLKVLALYLAKLHQQGVYHDDFSGAHLYLPPIDTGLTINSVTVIDLDNARVYGNSVRQWNRAKNVFQFLRSIPALTRAEKLRFLVHYFQNARINKTRWHRFIKLVNIISMLKQEKRPF